MIGEPTKPIQPKSSLLLEAHPKNKNIQYTKVNTKQTPPATTNSLITKQPQVRRQDKLNDRRHRYMESISKGPWAEKHVRTSTAPEKQLEQLPQQQMLFVPTGLRLFSNSNSR